MKKNILSFILLVILICMSTYFLMEQRYLKKQIEDLKNKDVLALRELKIVNKFGDTVVELSQNKYFNGRISLYNKSNANTININGGNEDENPAILLLKGEDKICFAMMVQESKNVINLYNNNGVDAVSIGTDDHGNGGYSIKNVHENIIKAEGWGWRAYNY